jgi:xanthine dehydrogenase YagS FAD-binding subunit
MSVLDYVRPDDVLEAVDLVGADPRAGFLAGGTTQVDLLLKDGVLALDRLVDITRLPLRGVALENDVLVVGALTTMEELAEDHVVKRDLPLVREALLRGASVQLRNMATIGGNLLQRTRCRYFRDPTVEACNKRAPGSGCAAMGGNARMHAVLGTSEHCIALHASDLAVALTALGGAVRTQGRRAGRRIPLTELYRLPADRPDLENVLERGELITAVELPLLPRGARSTYVKVRDRASYEFALASAAVVLVIEDGLIREARVALGGLGTVPWRARAAEAVLTGASPTTAIFRAAAESALEGAVTVPGTAFKVELGKRTLVRTLQLVLEDRP